MKHRDPLFTFIKKGMAKASILFLLVSLFPFQPPQARADVTSITAVTYEALNQQANASVVSVTFGGGNLTNASAIACQGTPPGITVCYDKNSITLGGPGWAKTNQNIVAAYRNDVVNQNTLSFFFNDASAAISDPAAATVTVNNFGGISGGPLMSNAISTYSQGGGGISNVAGADQDTNFGLDGRDFRVTWTPAQNAPTGYVATKIFIVPNALSVAVNTISTNACGGNPCQDKGFLNQYANNSFTLAQQSTNDSAGTPWNAGTPYKACVLIDAATDDFACGSSFNVTDDAGGTDTTPPFIEHKNVFKFVTSAKLIVYASVSDVQTTDAEFQAGTNGASFQMFTDEIAQNTVTAPVSGAKVSNTPNLWKFETANTLSRPVKYFLKARDKAGNIKYFTQNPAVDTNVSATDGDAAVAAFTVEAVVANSGIGISGTIKKSSDGNAIDNGAFVYLGGWGVAGVVTANGNGQYTFSNVPIGSYDLSATRSSYCGQSRFETISANATNIDLLLNSGECNYVPQGGTGSAGYGGGKPHVMFSGPSQGSTGVPLNEKIRVGFDTSLNASTVNDADPTNSGSNVYLTTDDGTTKIAGTVTYCASQSSAGCSSLFSMDNNTILFSPTADLTTNTSYTLVITQGVTSESGQSVEGNRSGGGHNINFFTGGGTLSQNTITQNFGNTGQYMPPFVRSMVPAPGVSAPVGTNILLEFNEPMNTTTLTPTNIQLWNMTSGSGTQVTLQASEITVDSAEQRFVTINPGTNLSAGSYEVRVKGAVAAASGMTIRPPDQASGDAFKSQFNPSSSVTAGNLSVFPMAASGGTVAVNVGALQFGFSDPISPSSVTSSNITLTRGSTSVPFSLKYDPGQNVLYVVPDEVFAPSTAYTVTFNANGLGSVEGGTLASASTVTYTSGAADTTQFGLKEARCDDYTCTLFFTEPVNNDSQVDSGYTNSVLKSDNLTLNAGGNPVSLNGKQFSYDPRNNSVKIEGLSLVAGNNFTFQAGASLKDLSGNIASIMTNSFTGKVESSANTFGTFGDQGMFGPPVAGGTVGGEFKPQGFGSFTTEQFAFGTADNAFPFNQIAGQSANVFQVRFTPGVVVANGNQVVISFPVGTDVTNAVPDTLSPFFTDINEPFRAGTIAFDTSYGGDGVSVDATTRTVTIQLAVTGTPGANDQYVIDLRGIVNPAIPKGPETGGYTAGLKLMQGGTAAVNKTTMPYFIKEGGSRTITINVKAGNADTPDNVTGSVFLHGGGPAGPLDQSVSVANGSGQVVFSGLNDGCYFFGTEPFVTIGANDYFGQMSPDPICINGSNGSKTIVLSSASGNASVPLTVKLAGIANLGGVDVDIFAGGPGRFVVKNLTAVGAPNVNGYTINLPQDGNWFVGVGPGMPKGSTPGSMPKPLPGVPPPPMSLNVAGVGTGNATITASQFGLPPEGVSFDSGTRTLTFTFGSADKAVSGTVKDGGGNNLQNVQVFMHQQGRGAPAFTTTKADGTFSISVSQFGSYEIGAMKDGMPPKMDQIEVKADGSDAGADIDIFYKGKQITGSNPLVISMKKPSYTISGKVLDAVSNGNAIAYAPVFATDSNGYFIPGGMTDANGNYSVFVDAGTWTVRSELPPSKTDSCGTFSTSVTITTESKANQNITPSSATCYTISGTVSVGGSALANVPLMVDEWDTNNSRPVAGGVFKPGSTDSSGAYNVKVAGNKTYHIGTFHPDYGELSITQAVTTSNVSNANITVGSTGTLTFAFTGGTAGMNAFVEVKKSDDIGTRVGKQKNGLNSNMTFTVKAGTYNYFVDVFGIGKYSGTVATGNTATIDLSSTSLVSLSGSVMDGNTAQSADVAGVLVTARDTSTGAVLATDVTDANGEYSMNLKPGTYKVEAAVAGYTPGQASATVSVSSNTANYDFGGASGDQAGMVKTDKVITGTAYKSDGSTPMTDGFVTATNGTVTVSAPIEPATGTYSLPVTSGTWTVNAKGPLHADTTKSSAVTVSSGDASGQNITLTADATKVPASASKTIESSTGGVIDDTANSGIKVNTTAGVLQTGSGNVTVEVEKGYNAPDTKESAPLGDASFDISGTASDSSTIKNLQGNAEVQLNYTSLVTNLPSGVSESDLQLAYFSPERNEYVPVEGGYTVDSTNNTITGQTNHLTTFAIIYPTSKVSSATVGSRRDNTDQITTTTTTTTSGGGGGGGAAPIAPAKDSNTVTSTISSKLEATVSTNTTIDRPVKLESTLLAVDPATKTKTAQLTTEAGSLTLKPNKDSTVSVEFAPDTKVTGTQDWNGNITPPLVKPVTVINKGGEAVEGGAQRLTREDVNTVVYVGSSTSSLTFSKPVKVEVPVQNLSDGAIVQVYSSEDGDHWKLLSADKFTVQGGKVAFASTHFTYFAVVKTGEVNQAVAAEAVKQEATAQPVSETAAPMKASFQDVVGHWSAEFVNQLYSLGVVSGKNSSAFAPDDPITRAEMTKIALNAFGYTVPSAGGAKPFSDVDPFAWYASYVQVAKAEKIVGGYSDGAFRPNQPVTRAEALKILAAAAKLSVDPAGVFLFKDTPQVSWYMKFIAFAKANDIVSGYPDGTFRPNASVTRAEVAKITVKIMNME